MNAVGPFICYGRTRAAFCKNIFFIFAGFNKHQTTVRAATLVVGHTPSSTSAKTVVHFFQYAKTPRFQRFDYGQDLNVLN
ncbi:unnamed protein product, partial [Allacma fusca]